MYARLKYLFNEGFYIFALSYWGDTQDGEIDYAREKVRLQEESITEKFSKVSHKEYRKCQKLLKEIQ